jgi:hypothetical protein
MKLCTYLTKTLHHASKRPGMTHVTVPVSMLQRASLLANVAEQLLAMRADGNWQPTEAMDYIADVFADVLGGNPRTSGGEGGIRTHVTSKT